MSEKNIMWYKKIQKALFELVSYMYSPVTFFRYAFSTACLISQSHDSSSVY